jgi:hypothetical protein
VSGHSVMQCWRLKRTPDLSRAKAALSQLS